MRKRIKLISGGLFILGAILGIGLFWVIHNKRLDSNTPIKPSSQGQNQSQPPLVQEKKAICPLDGTLVPEKWANNRPIAVMIENSVPARPQTGLAEAQLIYEALTEGGITRFMAIYACQEPAKVGPVRSARIYFLDWLSEFDAFFAHVGGNYDALLQIKKQGILDLDQFRYASAYWREIQPNKAKEHTMYTSIPKLKQLAEKNHWQTKGSYPLYQFKDDLPPSERKDSQVITINFSRPAFLVKWKYQALTNSYLREQTNGPKIEAKNIIIQWVERWPTTSPIGEKGYQMKTIGTGKALIFLDGQRIEGRWKKDSRQSRTRFYNNQGQEIQFNRGQTWIEIVHPGISINVS